MLHEFPSYRQDQQSQYNAAAGQQGGKAKGQGAFMTIAGWFSSKKTEVLEQNAPPSWHMQKQY